MLNIVSLQPSYETFPVKERQAEPYVVAFKLNSFEVNRYLCFGVQDNVFFNICF